VLFLAGERDNVIAGVGAERLTASIGSVATDLRGVTLFSGAGHWVQQERPAETNAAVVQFLKSLPRQ